MRGADRCDRAASGSFPSTPRQPASTSPAQRIRVLLIAPSLEIVGGQSEQAARLLEHLRAEPGVEIAFIPMDPHLPPPLASVRYLRTALRFFLFLCSLVVRVRSYDVLHVFSASYWSFLLSAAPVLIAGRLLRRRTVLNYRDGRVEDHLQRWRTARIARLADAIVTPSPYTTRAFTLCGYRAETIADIIDTERFPYRERQHPRPLFLTNRGLEPLYNVGCVLRAFAIVQQAYPAACLTIGHDGPCRPGLEALAAELGLKNYRFIGRVDRNAQPGVYGAADIYLMAPNFDCLPGSVVECFSSGLPVIATEVGGLPHLITHGETGLLVAPNDAEGLARAAMRVLEEPGLAAQLTAKAKLELHKYCWDSIGGRWTGLYRRLLETR